MNCIKDCFFSLFRIPFLFFNLIVHSLYLSAQIAPTESVGLECNQSRTIEYPFLKDTGSIKGLNKNSITQTIQYEQRDQFSFWYKIKIKNDAKISFRVTPENKNDKYIVYVYKYSDADFCDKVFNNKIKPLKLNSGEKRKVAIDTDDANVFDLNTKKGEGYYVCVLTLSQNNCGHNLQLASNSDTLNISALHLPCSTTDKRLLSFIKFKEQEQKKDSVKENKEVIYDTVLIAVKDMAKGHRKVSGVVSIKDETNKSLRIDSTSAKQTKIIIERGKKYKVNCSATGYKKFSYDMVISEYVVPDSNTFTIYMKLLKAGDNFVMDNIYFYPNTYALKDESQEALDNLLEYLINNPEVKIELQGHTNGNNKCKKNKAYKDKGPEWNFSGSAKKLSLLRAEEIKKYLVAHGVVKSNIKTIGFGGDRMIVANAKSPEALKKNVRVEIIIIEDGGL